MAVEHIRRPDVLGDLNRGTAEFAVALRVIREIADGISVNAVAIEVCRIIHEKVPHTIQQRSVKNRREPQPNPQWHRKTGNDDGAGLGSPVPREDYSHFVTARHKSFRKRLHDIGQAAGLGKWQSFGSHKQDSHDFVRNSCTLLPTTPERSILNGGDASSLAQIRTHRKRARSAANHETGFSVRLAWM